MWKVRVVTYNIFFYELCVYNNYTKSRVNCFSTYSSSKLNADNNCCHVANQLCKLAAAWRVAEPQLNSSLRKLFMALKISHLDSLPVILCLMPPLDLRTMRYK